MELLEESSRTFVGKYLSGGSDTSGDAGIGVIGGGPAGLMAAWVLAGRGLSVDVFEAMGSPGRKFLLAGKGGLNLTHSEPMPAFAARYRGGAGAVEAIHGWLRRFSPDDLRAFSAELGFDTFIGSSGRVFPKDMKAGPLLRTFVRRLKERGVRFHVQHRFRGWSARGEVCFITPEGEVAYKRAAWLLALGGGSYAKLGSDGAWWKALRKAGIALAPLAPSNCGFHCVFSETFAQRFEGEPLKPLAARVGGEGGDFLRGELVFTRHGIEGGLVYALSAPLREALKRNGAATLELDLAPEKTARAIETALSQPRGKRSLSEFWRRHGIAGVKAGLLHEFVPREQWHDAAAIARALKCLPLPIHATAPMDEAISTAGGVMFADVDEGLMLKRHPGCFVAGEMLDWEAPTGGYLLTACFASGVMAAEGIVDWLAHRERADAL